MAGGIRGRFGAEAIPVQTRMMTIADIFDALTAPDRPYKRAVPSGARAGHPAHGGDDGMLDAHLLRTFIERAVFDQQRSGGFDGLKANKPTNQP